jgi:hypothetical protein
MMVIKPEFTILKIAQKEEKRRIKIANIKKSVLKKSTE